ncbi:MAG: phosphoglycolate phosphatase [Thermoplasmata archaeon]|nr:phosphoglycolate phosphatase [Thermoplasmata archaeon]
MVFKAVATDIDGTITDESRRINISVIRAFRNLEKKGIKVILISGNVLPVTMGFKIFIGTSGPIVSENGGILMYENRIIKNFEKNDIESAYIEFKKIKPDAERIITDRWRETSIALVPTMDIQSVKNFFIPLGFRVEATGFGIHITHKEQNKFFGLKKAAEILGISTDEIVAFGDSENDVEMVENAGLGIAVKNAWEIVKEKADYITNKKFGNGVVEGLKRLGLI